MNTISEIISDIEEIHQKHRIPFEEKFNNPNLEEVCNRIEKASLDIAEDVAKKKLIERVLALDCDEGHKNRVVSLLKQGSLNVATLLLQFPKG